MDNKNQNRTPSSVRLRARELRKEMTPAEKTLWERLRDRQLAGLKFRRQAAIGPFIADFYCAEKRLVIEVDGDIHDLRVEEDAARTRQLQDHGYHVIRFRNEDVESDLATVLSKIQQACG